MLLYLHIPYCDSKCHYCSFNSYVDKFDTRKAYMKALHRQLLSELERFEAKKGSLETLFIGGGTPSTIAPELYEPIFGTLQPYLKNDAEITMEANPNSADKKWLDGIRRLGVNRISFGVQSFDRAKLRALNRAHSPREAIRAVHNAAELGFEHLSLDLIYNYRGDSEALLAADIETAFSLPIDHISAYELTIEARTFFSKTPDARQENDSLAFFVADNITEKGFEHYEISNFGSYRIRHNMGYWQLKNYIGAGAGAVGFKKDRRFYPHPDIDAYIGNPSYTKEEMIDGDALRTEKIFLGLRSLVGVESRVLTKKMRERAAWLVEEKKLDYDGKRYRNRNFFLADEIALYLLD